MAVDQRDLVGPGEGRARPPGGGGRLALSTVFFSLATGLSRVAGLGREIVAASYFGVTGPMSAFTVAFQIPNLMAALFAAAALQGAFVPVFTGLLEKGRREEAFRVASSLFSLIAVVLGALTVIFLLAAPLVMRAVTPGFNHHLQELTIQLSRVMFPIVMLLALSGVVVGMLNSLEHFSVPALAPIVWNLVIILSLVILTPGLHGDDRVYAYAVGVLAGTVVQFLLPLPWLRGRGARFTLSFAWRNEHVRQVLRLMLPVTIALGLINFDAVINSLVGSLIKGNQAPAAIDKAFRIYMLPQGIFSVAIATILFPTLSRLAARGARAELRSTMANGTRLILLTLIPSAAIMAVLATPITRLVYERGEFNAHATHLVAVAMLWWSLSLPAQGASLLFSRTFFSLQKPWFTTALAVANLAVNAALSFALYKPFGIAGVVLGSVAGTLVMAGSQAAVLRRDLDGIDAARTLSVSLRLLLASAGLAIVSYGAWNVLDDALGRSLAAQATSLALAIGAGLAVYAVAVLAMQVAEAHQIRRLIVARLRR
ncbi:MAG: murein biosynthesis integral membrane protein MurJ [Thermoleophilaceae bacterium]